VRTREPDQRIVWLGSGNQTNQGSWMWWNLRC